MKEKKDNVMNSKKCDDVGEKGGPNVPQNENGGLVAETNSPKI
jgi:hypothetical protein